MNEEQLVFMTSEVLWLVLMLSLPVVLVAATVGGIVGLLQALTQIQDQTVSYVCKLVACVLTLALTYHWMGTTLLQYTSRGFDLISRMGGNG